VTDDQDESHERLVRAAVDRVSADLGFPSSDDRARAAGFTLLTPASFHYDQAHWGEHPHASTYLCWECPACGAVVARVSWEKHAEWHRGTRGYGRGSR